MKSDIKIKHARAGRESELRFALSAYEKGFIVSLPFGGDTIYDAIVDNNGKLTRVQVKTVNNRAVDSNKFKLNTLHASGTEKYSSSDVDVIAGYIKSLDIWYFIPVNLVETQTCVCLYPHKNAKDCKYEIYKENWNIFS